jgi:hydroxyacylglutathione hydrolase
VEKIADGVWRIALPPGGAVNAYLVGDVLVDAGYPFTATRLLRELEGREVRAHALTHGHVDHAGGSKRACDALGVPLWCPAGDAHAVRRGYGDAKGGPLGYPLTRVNFWPGIEADRLLREGDEVAGFSVLDTPGHSPGHIALWRATDRVLIAGDVWFNLHLLTLRPGLRQPPWAFTPDPRRNRESMHRLADLDPAIACFGHGPVVRDAAPKLRAFVDAL